MKMFLLGCIVSACLSSVSLAVMSPQCSAVFVESGRHAGIWATHEGSGESAVLTATATSGTFVGVYSRHESAGTSLAIALTPQGIQFRGCDGKPQTLTLQQLQALKSRITADTP